MTWLTLAAVLCGLVVGSILSLWYTCWRDEQRFTRKQARLDALLTELEQAVTQAEAVVRSQAYAQLTEPDGGVVLSPITVGACAGIPTTPHERWTPR